jgi:dolichol-phosphate mannosyltransferase
MRRVVVRVSMSEQLETAAATSRKPSHGLCAAVIAMIAGLTLLRLAMCGVTELIPEETYYWTYAKHPALGYYDHPPMVAWFVTLGTALLGDTPMGVRIMTLLLWVATAGLLFLTGRMWFGKRVALLATLIFTLLPVYVGTGFIVTPDAPLLFFWMATLYLISRALQTGRGWCWLLAAVAFGGALLSKYYGLLLAPSLLWFLLLSPKHRHWLRRAEFWLALPIALAVFSPVIIWNSHHEWASFLFQSTRTTGVIKNAWRDVLIFWLVQFGVLTPPLFALFAVTAVHGVRRGWYQRDESWNFVASFSLPLFLLFAVASFKTQIHVNWTAPAFLSLSLGASAMALDGLESDQPQRAKRWRWGAWGTVVLCGLVIALGHTSLAWGTPQSLAYAHAGGWQAVSQQVDIARAKLREETRQQPFVLGMDKYNIAAEIGFYLRSPNECVNMFATGGQGLGYRYWTDLAKFEGRPAIAVVPEPTPDVLSQLRRHFEHIGDPQFVQVPRYRGLSRQVYLLICTGYHAADLPPNPR